jgi:hypothetical protein
MPTRSTKRGQLLSRPCLSATAQRTSTPMRSRWNFWCPAGVSSIMSNVRSSSFAVVAAAALVGMLVGVAGTKLFRGDHPNVPSPTTYRAPQPLGSIDGSLTVEALVDSNGRVQDYRVLSAATNLPLKPRTCSFLRHFVRQLSWASRQAEPLPSSSPN